MSGKIFMLYILCGGKMSLLQSANRNHIIFLEGIWREWKNEQKNGSGDRKDNGPLFGRVQKTILAISKT